ncbi:MAG: hypothetical protein PHQ41_01005 [Candidatus Cloacimonetes bacterium]|nr:hypothetical protein [Candidatus Cloacimonadota bacterium]
MQYPLLERGLATASLNGDEPAAVQFTIFPADNVGTWKQLAGWWSVVAPEA